MCFNVKQTAIFTIHSFQMREMLRCDFFFLNGPHVRTACATAFQKPHCTRTILRANAFNEQHIRKIQRVKKSTQR